MPLEPDPYAIPAEPEQERTPLAPAMAKAGALGVMKDVVAPAFDLPAWGADNPDGFLAKTGAAFRGIASAIEESIPKDRRADMDAAIAPGEGQQSVLKNPGSSAGMKIARAAGPLAGLLAFKGVGAQAALGAAQNAGNFIGDVKDQIEGASDDALTQKYPVFAENVRLGLSPDLARKLLVDDLTNGRDVSIAAIGGAAGGVGLGRAAHGATSGVLRRAGVGAAEAGLGMAVGAGATDASRQLGEIDTGARQDYDYGQTTRAVVNAGFEGTVLGGTLGAGSGILGKGAQRIRDRAAGKVDKPAVDVLVGDGNTPTPEVAAAMGGDPSDQRAPTGLDARIAQEETRLATRPPEGVEQQPVPPAGLPLEGQVAKVGQPIAPPLPADAAARPVVEHPPAAPTTGLEKLGGMATAMSDNLYGQAFDALATGKDTISGVKDPLLQRHKAAFDAGLIKSPADLRAHEEGKVTPKGNEPATVAAPDMGAQKAALGELIHQTTAEKIPFKKAQQAIMEARKTAGDEPLTYSGLLKVFQQMVKDGELSYHPTGYKSLREPKVAEAVAPARAAGEPAKAVEPAAAPAPTAKSAPAVEPVKASRPAREPITREEAARRQKEIDDSVDALVPKIKAARDAGDTVLEKQLHDELRRWEIRQSGLDRATMRAGHDGDTELIAAATGKKAPPTPTPAEAAIAKRVAEKIAVNPEGSTAVKIARKVLKAKTSDAPSVGVDKATGARVLKAAPTPEVIAAKEAKAIEDATASQRKSEADRKAESRLDFHKQNDEKARKLFEEHTEDVGTAVPHEEKALGGDKVAQEHVVNRARRLLGNAEEAGITIQRQPHTRLDPDNRDPTPYATFLRAAQRLAMFGQKAEGERRADMFREYIAAERALRRGDTEAAAADRLERNSRLTAEHKEAKRGADDAPNYDQHATADGEPRPLAAAIDDPTNGNTFVEENGQRYYEVAGDKVAPPEGTHSSKVATSYRLPEKLWHAINKYASHKASDLLQTVEMPKDATPAQRDFINLFNKVVARIGDVASKTDIVVVPDHVLTESGMGGLFMTPKRELFADGHNGVIVIGESHLRSDVVAHEVVHAATSRELFVNDKLRADVQDLLQQVRDNWKGDPREYGLTNEHEFLTVAMTDMQFQQQLMMTPLKKGYTGFWGNVRTVWGSLVDKIGRAFGLKTKREMNALEAALAAADEVMHRQEEGRDIARFQEAMNEPDVLARIAPWGKEELAKYWDRNGLDATDWKLRVARTFQKLATTTQLGNTSDHLFGPGTPARSLAEAINRMGTGRDKIAKQAEPLVLELHALERKYEASGVFKKFEEFMLHETNSKVFADVPLEQQKHLGKDSMEGWQPKARHAELEAEWGALPQDLKDVRTKLHEFFRERQNQMSLGLIRNSLKAISEDGLGSEALAQRIFNRTLTKADEAVIGGDAVLKTIRDATNLAKIAGPYVPNMRRGDYVVSGKWVIETPANARRLNGDEKVDPQGNVFEFKTREEAKKFAETTDLHVEDVRNVYVDPTTGSRRVADEDGKERYLTKEEPSAEHRVRVEVQDKHVEFFERPKDAKQRRTELASAPNLRDVSHVDIRRMNAAQAGNNFMPTQIQRMATAIQNRASFQALHKGAQAELLRHLQEAGIQAMSTTRAQTRRLPRTRVSGASTELARNAQDYNGSTAGYLSRLAHQPTIDGLLKDMQAHTDKTPYQGNDDGTQLYRRQRLQEFERRIYGINDPEPQGLFHKITSRLLQVSYLDKLASPAFHVINSMEPWTVSMPILGGRHGGLASSRALQMAYGAIGAGRALGAGLRDTARAFSQNSGLTDYNKSFVDRVRGEVDGEGLAKLMHHLSDVGLMSRDAGMELNRVVRPDANLVGRALDRADLMARQLGTAVESVNRAVTGIAAYRLEMRKGADHATAVKYATEVVHDSMGDYNSWNAPPIFNHPLGRLALQFRKYAQKTYYLMGKQMVAAAKGDREAMKSFAMLMATHMSVAGALGLPLEAVKLGMMGAGLMGLTNSTYDDLEQNVRKGASKVFGRDGGEIFTRGLPRWAGFDLAGRMGLNSLLLSPIDPKSMKPDDMYAYLAKSFMGAPASYLMDATQGFQKIAQGDVLEGTRLITPLKVYADSVQAYQLWSQGRKSQAGKQLLDPIRLDQAIVKAIGFTPGAVAEQTEQSFAIRGDQKARKEARDKMIGNWVAAQPADKRSQWQDVQAWNKSQPDNAKINMGDLLKAQQRRVKETSSGNYSKGIRYTKRDADLKEANSFYNTP